MNDHLTEKEKTDKTYTAIFGDGNGDVGMKKKVDAMYEVFAAANLSGKIARGVIYFGAAVASCGYVIWKVIHGQNPF